MSMGDIIVDFNDRDEDGNYPVLLEHAPDVSVGEVLRVFDDEGGSYKAQVTDVDRARGLLRLAVDLTDDVGLGTARSVVHA